MGKTQSRLEDAAKAVRALEAEEKPQRDAAAYRRALADHARLARAEGKLEDAAASLDKLLTQAADDAERAQVACDLGNVLRLQFANGAGLVPSDRTALLARAEDLVITALATREAQLAAAPDDPSVKLAVAKAKATLSMVQMAYGRVEDSRRQHEGALELVAQFALRNDPQKLVWSPTHHAFVSPSGDVVRPEDVASAAPPPLLADTTTTTTTATMPSSPASPTLQPTPTTTTTTAKPPTWRLVLLPPPPANDAASTRRPSAVRYLTGKSAKSSPLPPPTDTSDATAVVELPPLDASSSSLSPPTRLELGLSLPPPSKPSKPTKPTKPPTTPPPTFIPLGTKAKHARELSERHAALERLPNGMGWAVEDLQPVSSSKGVRVNGVRVLRAHLRPGDVVVFGGAGKLALGATDSSRREGLAYAVQRVVDGVEDAAATAATSIAATQQPAPYSPNLASTGATTTGNSLDAFKYFCVLATTAQINLDGANAKLLTGDKLEELFARAGKERVPFHLWSTWLYAELAKQRIAPSLGQR